MSVSGITLLHYQGNPSENCKKTRESRGDSVFRCPCVLWSLARVTGCTWAASEGVRGTGMLKSGTASSPPADRLPAPELLLIRAGSELTGRAAACRHFRRWHTLISNWRRSVYAQHPISQIKHLSRGGARGRQHLNTPMAQHNTPHAQIPTDEKRAMQRAKEGGMLQKALFITQERDKQWHLANVCFCKVSHSCYLVHCKKKVSLSSLIQWRRLI